MKSASFKSAAILAAALGLAGCVAGEQTRVVSIAAQPSGVEGSWVDESGVGVSTFSGGTFSTTALDNGSQLSQGTYRYQGSNMVSITGTSLIRQQPIAFNCAVATPSQLNCTSSDGNRFVLTRRA